MNLKKFIVIILASISVTGIIGIPMGDPKFFVQAISLELIFISLTILAIKKFRYTIIPNIIIGIVIIFGNTLSPQHIDIMFTFTPIGNAIILIIGGYVLQAILICSNLLILKNHNFIILKK